MTFICSNSTGDAAGLRQPAFTPQPADDRAAFSACELLCVAPQFREEVINSVRQNNVVIAQMPCRQPAALAAHFNRLRESLLCQAEAWFQHFVPAARQLPDLTRDMAEGEMMAEIFRVSDGLIIGENHASTISKQLLSENMALLSRAGVKTLYMEGLMSDIHQSDLDVWFADPRHALPADVATFLDNATSNDSLSSLLHLAPASTARYREILVAAKAQGIRVVALDCSTTYLLGDQDAQYQTSFPYERILLMNFFAGSVIGHYQRQPDAGKYVVLAGDSHINTATFASPLYLPIAGLAEISGAVGLDIKETGTRQLCRGVVPGLPLQEMSLTRLKYVVTPDFTLTR